MKSIYRTEGSREALASFMDEVLKLWPYPFAAQYVDTRFGKTHAVTAGSKDCPALVLLHGSASNLLSFGGDIPQYMGNYYVVAPDLPGEAGKSGPERPDWRKEDFVLWMDDVLDAFGIRETALLGVSLGGWIAAKYAAHRPGRVRSLVLNAPAGLVPARKSIIIKEILYTMRKNSDNGKMLKNVFGEAEIPAEVKMFMDLVQKNLKPRIGSPPLLKDSEFASIKARVFMTAGEKDAFFNTQKAADRLRSALPDAEIQIIPEGQHALTGNNSRLMEFMNDNK